MVGNVFEGPNLRSCIDGFRLANGGAGVLQLIGNYGGERMNFGMVREMMEDEGIAVATVLGTDDIASAGPEEREKRRGVAGLIFAYKAAGARAEQGGTLADVREARNGPSSGRGQSVSLSVLVISPARIVPGLSSQTVKSKWG